MLKQRNEKQGMILILQVNNKKDLVSNQRKRKLNKKLNLYVRKDKE